MPIIFIIFALITGCSHTAEKRQDEAYMHLRLGNSFYRSGDYPRALTEFRKATELSPDDPVARNNLGMIHFAQKQYALALEQLLKALELKPNYTEARNNLARVYIETERFDDAKREIKAVLADLSYPEPDKGWFNLGLLYFKQKDYLGAQKQFVQALKIQRQSCLSYNYYARTFYELKEYQKGVPLFERAIQLCEPQQFEEPLYYSALNLFQAGEQAKARARLEELLEKYSFSEYGDRAKLMLKSMGDRQ